MSDKGSYKTKNELLALMKASWGGEQSQSVVTARGQAQLLKSTLGKIISGMALNERDRIILDHINDAESELMILGGRISSYSEAFTSLVLAAKEGTIGGAQPQDALEAIMGFAIELQQFNAANIAQGRICSKILQKAREILVPE